ncbi:MAG: penicillin-binding protein activator LpoB [Kiritimatiellia bacterium]|jgi:PBP1b-binding outer membrane lipoprotein LpoB
MKKMQIARNSMTIIAAGWILLAGSGCAMFRASTSDLDLDRKPHLKADYDFVDMREISQSIADEMINTFLTRQSEPPIMMIPGIENRTSQYVDTKALTDRMRTEVIRSGKAQFINEARRADLLAEQGYQAANATPETQALIGRQLGAKYMVTGSLIEMSQTGPREVRISKTREKYYKLTLEVTDLETSIIAWTTEREFARGASEPLIGW